MFPGAVVLIARGEALLHAAAYGATVYEPASASPTTLDTIYDVASLTKMFTATAALRLLEAGRLDLRAPVASYLPEFKPRDVQIWHLLTHTSGLDIRLSALRHAGAAGLWAAVYGLEPAHPPGSTVAYTNVNSLLLGEVVARLSGAPLDRALAELVLAPLGLSATCFVPPPQLRARIAPTEHDAEWRGGLVHGSVHDESAHALGGVAGHAGLFSTAGDLGRFCAAWLPGGPAPRLLGEPTIRLATANHTPSLSAACGLGWMIDRPNFMGAAPLGTIGHTGFTGPAIVIVPAEQLCVVVLSNRVYPQRTPARHHDITAQIVALARNLFKNIPNNHT